MELVLPDFGTFFWMVLVFSIVLFILRKFAWKPITSALYEREKSIENALNAADKARKDMEKLQANNEKILQEARHERDNMLNDAREMKEQIVNEAKDKANAESKKLIEAARLSINNENAAALNDIKKQVAILSVEIAEKLIREKLKDEKAQNEIIEKMLNDIKLN